MRTASAFRTSIFCFLIWHFLVGSATAESWGEWKRLALPKGASGVLQAEMLTGSDGEPVLFALDQNGAIWVTSTGTEIDYSCAKEPLSQAVFEAMKRFLCRPGQVYEGDISGVYEDDPIPGPKPTMPAICDEEYGNEPRYTTQCVSRFERIWTGWQRPGGGVPVVFTDFSVEKAANGRLTVFALAANLQQVWRMEQSVSSGSWGAWVSVAAPTKTTGGTAIFDSAFKLAKHDDGRLAVFGIDTDGEVWRLDQSAPNGSWLGWNSMGQPGTLPEKPVEIVVRRQADGSLIALAHVGRKAGAYKYYVGSIRTREQKGPNGTWGPWLDFGNLPPNIAQPGLRWPPLPVLSQADGRLTLFATAQKPNPFLRRPFPEFDEVTLFMRSQDATGAWLPWEEFVERNFVINHDHSFSPPFATGMTGDGRAGIFLGEYAFMDRKVYYALQTAANGAFQRWKSLGHPPAEHVAATTATGAANWYREVVHLRVASNSDGRLELVALVRESLLENVGGVLLQQLPNYHLWHIRQD